MHRTLFVLVSVLIIAALAQEPAPAPSNTQPDDVTRYINLGVNIALIVFGLLWVFFGYRLVSVVLFLAGFVTFAFILLSVLSAYAAPPTMAVWLHYVIAAGAGLIGGFLFVCLKKVGFFLLGFLLGVIFSAIIIGATPLATILTTNSALIPLIIILSTGLVFGIATVFAVRPLLIIGTSFNGSYLIGVTLDDLLLHTSVSELLPHIISNFTTPLQFTNDWKPYVVLAGIVVFALIGIFVQWRFTSRGASHEGTNKKQEEYQMLLQNNV